MTVQENIQKILWDKRYLIIPEDMQKPSDITYLMIDDFTVADRNFYSFIKELEYKSAIKFGVPTENELLEEAKLVGFWTAEDEQILNTANEYVVELQSELERQKFLARKKSIQKQIDNVLEKKKSVDERRHTYYANSAEYYAHEIATYSLVRRVVRKPDNTLLWSDDTTFLLFKQDYIPLIIYITHQVMSEGMLEISDLRKIARSAEWRLIWTLQRENLPGIFNRPVGNLTLNHKLLIYWSRLYDSAFESTEPPDLDIVNDDDKFDEWLSNKNTDKSEQKDSVKDHQEQLRVLDGEYIEICTCGAKKKNFGKGLGEKIPHINCSYGVFKKYTPEEKQEIAKQIYARNSDRVRNIVDKEQNTVADVGLVEEQHLRGKKTRLMLGMKQNEKK